MQLEWKLDRVSFQIPALCVCVCVVVIAVAAVAVAAVRIEYWPTDENKWYPFTLLVVNGVSDEMGAIFILYVSLSPSLAHSDSICLQFVS